MPNGPPRAAIIITRRNTYTRRQRQTADAAGAENPLGAQQPARSIISSTTNWCPPRAACRRRCCARSSRFPTTKDLVPYNAGFLSGWVVERYQIDLVAAAKNRARRNGRGRCTPCAPPQVPGDTHRNLQVRGRLFRPDLQAHPRADLAADLQLRRADISRSSSTATPAPSRANIPRAGSRFSLPCWPAWPPLGSSRG